MAGISAITPMLAVPQGDTRIETLVGTHVFEPKLDGVRSLLIWQPHRPAKVVLTSRSGRAQNQSFPDLIRRAEEYLPPDTALILDGEITAMSGRFEDVARRDKVTNPTERLIDTYPVRFYAFDILAMGEMDVRSWPYSKRRLMLEAFMSASPSGLVVVRSTPDASLLDDMRAAGLEGVIAKRADSRYRSGRQAAWVKFKNVHSITAVAVGYEPGEGARSHFGAMKLALIRDGVPEVVGRVGTGFSADETWEFKKRLDEGEWFVVEIEVGNVTRDGKLRFPSFKGVRGDLGVNDAVWEQLDTIPRSG